MVRCIAVANMPESPYVCVSLPFICASGNSSATLSVRSDLSVALSSYISLAWSPAIRPIEFFFSGLTSSDGARPRTYSTQDLSMTIR